MGSRTACRSRLGLGYLSAETGRRDARRPVPRRDLQTRVLVEAARPQFQPGRDPRTLGRPAARARSLGDRMTKWPGYGSLPDGSFQFDEHEFMKAEDYDAFLERPGDWAIRTYLPARLQRARGPRSTCRRWACRLFGYYNILLNLRRSTAPPVQQALEALGKAAAAQRRSRSAMSVAAGAGSRRGRRAAGDLARLPDRGAVRLHVGHAARHARHHAGPAPAARAAAGGRGEGARLPGRDTPSPRAGRPG